MLKRLVQALLQQRVGFGLAAGSGALYALGFCGYDQSYLAWICFVPLFAAWSRPGTSLRSAIAQAWLTGLVAHLACYTWIIYMLRVFAYLPLPLAGLGWFLLCLAQSGSFAVWGGLTWYLVQSRRVCLTLAAPAMLMVVEWCYPLLFPSFLSNALYRDLWAIQSAQLWGTLGLTGLLTLCSAVVWHVVSVLRTRRRSAAATSLNRVTTAACVLLCAFNGGFGHWAQRSTEAAIAETPADKQLRVGLVQTNMGIYEKFESPQEGLRRHREQSLQLQADGAQLLVWPESAFVRGIDSASTNVRGAVMGPGLHTPVLFGGIRYERQLGRPDRLYNTAFLLSDRGEILARYDKNHLLMFGEMLPFGELLPWLYSLSPQTSHFTPGRAPGVLDLGAWRLGMLICYEDILPGFVRATMAGAPDALVNITNDAWFGETREPRIHMALATFAAVSSKRFLVRATNTGISSIIDPTGRVVREAESHVRANLMDTITPFTEQTVYSRFGNWVVGPSLGLLLWHVRPKRKARARSSKREHPDAS